MRCRLTSKGTFHECFTKGVRTSCTLPTICIHMCKVAWVSFQESKGRSGQQFGESETAVVQGVSNWLYLDFNYMRDFRGIGCRRQLPGACKVADTIYSRPHGASNVCGHFTQW